MSISSRSGSGPSGSDQGAAVVAEGISKRYAGIPAPLYPQAVSIFHRGLFRRRREQGGDESSAAQEDERAVESPASASPAQRASLANDRRRQLLNDEISDDEDDEDEDDFEDEQLPTTTLHLEPFWALKDVSFRVEPGTALGILGDQGAGKSTLLRILGGTTFPTTGRVLVRGSASSPPDELAKGLAYTGRSTFEFNLNLGCRMLGISPRLVQPFRDEIEDLAPLELRPDGRPDPGSITRMAAAMAVVVPSSVILLEDGRSWEQRFTNQIVERARERVRGGTALVLATRTPDLIRELCDEALVLHEGRIVEGGRAKRAIRRYTARADRPIPGSRGKASSQPPMRETRSRGRKLRVPPVIPAFNAVAALAPGNLITAAGRLKRIDHAAQLTVEIQLETSMPDVEVQCGVNFIPRDGERMGVRVEFPETIRLVQAGKYSLVARTAPGTLEGGAYGVRADAVVASPSERAASVIAREIGRVRVVGDRNGMGAEPTEAPLVHWDGSVWRQAEAEWSIE